MLRLRRKVIYHERYIFTNDALDVEGKLTSLEQCSRLFTVGEGAYLQMLAAQKRTGGKMTLADRNPRHFSCIWDGDLALSFYNGSHSLVGLSLCCKKENIVADEKIIIYFPIIEHKTWFLMMTMTTQRPTRCFDRSDVIHSLCKKSFFTSDKLRMCTSFRYPTKPPVYSKK
jgi:hypothetical protein